ncbi:MAG: GDSL-type esterase/lipase family protein [Pirellulaceae bacterium]
MKNSSRIRTLTLAMIGGCLLSLVGVATAQNTATLPVPRDANWVNNRHMKINEAVKAAEGDVDLILIGDSITDAWSGPGKAAWTHHYGHRKAINAGIGGDRTQHVLWRLQNGNLDGITPKLAVIMIGTNNARDNKPEETAEGVTEIVNYLQKRLPETKILLLAIFPRGATVEDPLRQKNAKVNQIIAKLGEREGVTYQDIGSAFLDDKGTLSKDVMPDLLHLTPAAYWTWAQSIESNVAKLLGDEPVAAPETK